MRLILTIALGLTSVLPAQKANFWLHPGDSHLFWGDSITDDGVYPRTIENFVLTVFPHRTVTFTNLGWSGDRASFFPRMQRDIALCTPTTVTIMLGMNDGLYKPFDPEALDAYLDGMEHLLRILEERSNPRVMLIAPTTFDLRCRTDILLGRDTQKPHPKLIFYPETLRRFTLALQRLAHRRGLPFVNLNEAMLELLDDLNAVDPAFQITDDGIHPNVEGELFMALEILDAMGAPRDVATVAIDAAAGKVDSLSGCEIRQLQATPERVSFVRRDHRLPFPIYPSTREPILRVLRFYDQWSRDILRIANLYSGWYSLRIDGQLVAVLRAEELAKGVNLSRYPFTPMMLQAYKVFEATERRHDAFYTKWRRVLLKGVIHPHDYTPFATGVGVTSLDQAEKAAFEDQHRLNQPGEHRFEIGRVASGELPYPPKTLPCTQFLEDRVRIHIEVDANTLRNFEPPLCLGANFSYAPQYQWAIIETWHMYHDVPIRLYDDGTHGDANAGDGIYSIDLYFRRNAGKAWFFVQDGRFLREYWIHIDRPSHRNPELDHLTRVWASLSGLANQDSTALAFDTTRSLTLKWDKTLWRRALKKVLW